MVSNAQKNQLRKQQQNDCRRLEFHFHVCLKESFIATGLLESSCVEASLRVPQESMVPFCKHN